MSKLKDYYIRHFVFNNDYKKWFLCNLLKIYILY